MAKALMVRVYHVAKSGSNYEFTADVLVENGQGDATSMTVEITTPNFSDPQSVRRNAWRSAIITKAFQDLELVVDEVQFEDFTV